MTTARVSCVNCGSPDTAPETFSEDAWGAILREYYPQARHCMDCGHTFTPTQPSAPIDWANITKAKP